MNRVRPKPLMIAGSVSSAAGLILLTQLTAGTPYPELLASLILIGTGMGLSFVSLTTAALHGVAPADAGAASGLINVVQQLGAALGLAVLVTVFDSIQGANGLIGASAGTAVHSLDVTFAVGAAFALAALAIVAGLIRNPGERVETPAEVESGLEAAA